MASVDLTPFRAPRPHRADAARNYDAILAAAKAVFSEHGADASPEEVARRAGVGIATLYRNFQTRELLLENVYLAEIEAVCESAAEWQDHEPWDAIVGWLRRFIDYVATKRAVVAGLDRDSPGYRAAVAALYEAGGPLLERAQASGTMRTDVTIDDVMRMMMAFTTVNFASPQQRDHVLDVAFDGLAARR